MAKTGAPKKIMTAKTGRVAIDPLKTNEAASEQFGKKSVKPAVVMGTPVKTMPKMGRKR